ncbi:MAG TPA: calcium/sodium antiporter [Vicinamibacteria bacterium]
MSLATSLSFLLGLVFLILGAELLIRGASRIASALGVPPLIVGLTVVAFGTGSPEMAVSIESALAGRPDIAYGNVVGSNVVNILLILGFSAAIAPLTVPHQLLRVDVPIMVGASFLCALMSLNGRISRMEGLLLFVAMVLYTSWLVRESRKSRHKELAAEYREDFEVGPPSTRAWLGNGALVALGLAMLVHGSGWVVAGAVELARRVGLSELAIAAAIIAPGTSLPELAASVLAAYRGEREIAVGNAVGSNIFNILGVLGIASALSPTGVGVATEAIYFDTPVMVAVAVACLPVFFNGYRIARWEGFLFVSYYGFYLSYLILNSSRHEAIRWFGPAMAFFVIPLTVITLVVVTVRGIRSGRAQRA